MTSDVHYRQVLAAYPADCQPRQAEFLGSAGGFSGAQFWRLSTPAGLLCLRKWPAEHPTAERLTFIQSVLTHVYRHGMRRLPLPILSSAGQGFVAHAGCLWELTPWMPGRADYHESPSDGKLQAAMAALAEFHLATAGFPISGDLQGVSPGIRQRTEQLRAFQTSELSPLQRALAPDVWPQLLPLAERQLALFPLAARAVLAKLQRAERETVSLGPCIRDIWHDHVLFTGEQVTGLIDFGALQIDNVATDVARLLGSLVGDDPARRQIGLSAYSAVRPLSEGEQRLIQAFDQSSVLMSGLMWIHWIYAERRQFEGTAAILTRFEATLSRLEFLVSEFRRSHRPDA